MGRPRRFRFDPTPERAFLWLACAAGLAFLVLTPPLQVADENRHLNRSYMIAHGDPGAGEQRGLSGNPVPRSLTEMPERLGSRIAFYPGHKQDPARWRAEFRVELRPERTIFVPMPSRYSPVPYLPQALAILVLRPFEPPPVILLYASRVLNLSIWIALIFATLRIIPSHRWVLALLALTPMSLFTAASASADVLTNGLSFLLVGVILALRAAAKPVTVVRGLGLWLLATLTGLCKPVYWPLAALMLLIPGRLFGGRLRHAGILAAIYGGSLLPVILWSIYSASWNVPLAHEWLNPGEQILYLQSNPVAFLSALVVSVQDYAFVWVQMFVGVLGWLDTQLPGFVYVMYPSALLVAALLERPTPDGLSLRDRGLLFAVPGICWLAIMLVAYVLWTPVGAVAVMGFQGRYLIPLAPLLLIALQRPRGHGLSRWARIGVVAVIAVTLAIGVGAVVFRYHPGS